MTISVFLADDNLIVREGVKALLDLEDDGLVSGAEAANPQVIVTDIRMPPDFSREGIDAAKEVRKRHPGTGIVILSQFDDPDYAVSLLSEGAAGYAYLLKDRVGEGNQLARAVREVAAGGSVLDPKIVDALTSPVRTDASLSPAEETLLKQVAEGRTINAIAAHSQTTPADVDAAIEKLFVRLAEGLTAGRADSLHRLRMLQKAIVDRKEQGESLSRLLPGGVAARILEGGHMPGETEELTVTVLMSDIRAAQRASGRDEPGDPLQRRHRHAVCRRCGDGGVRGAGRPERSCRSGGGRRGGHAYRPAGPQRPVDLRGSAAIRARDRTVDGTCRCGSARLRRATRIHRGR